MISWDEIHKFDQPPVVINRIEDEIEITDENIEKNFDENQLSRIDFDENSFMRFGEEEPARQSNHSDSLNTKKSEISFKINEGTNL